jgi:hypothetical protein
MDLISKALSLSSCTYERIGNCGGSWALTTLLVIITGAIVFVAWKAGSYYTAAKKKL